MVRTEVANDPARIAQNPAMTSINTVLQVDLLGQANACRLGARIRSGFGGQTEFVLGALHSHGGQAFIALCCGTRGRTSRPSYRWSTSP